MSLSELPSKPDSIQQHIADPVFLTNLADTYCNIFLHNDPPEIHHPHTVKEQFIREMTLPGTLPYFVQYPSEGNDIQGFIWGYAASYDHHINHLLTNYFHHYSEERQQQLQQAIYSTVESFDRPISYINFVSEYGIVHGKRGMNIFPFLLSGMLSQQLPRQVSIDVSWSRKSFAMYDIVHMLEGVDVPFEPDDPTDDRVILVCDLLRIKELLGDDPVRNYMHLLRTYIGKRDHHE